MKLVKIHSHDGNNARWNRRFPPHETAPSRWAPRWNFHKYLVGRDDHITAVFATAIEPTDSRVIAAIEKELAGA